MKFYSARILAAVIIMLAFSLEVLAIERPVVLNAVIPAYPVVAAAKRISGAVLVDVEINGEGNVIAAVPITGHELLRNAAKKAVLGWRFKPLADGKSHSMRLTFIFHDVSYVAPEKKPEFMSPYQVEVEWVGTAH
jgi:TonB family protein